MILQNREIIKLHCIKLLLQKAKLHIYKNQKSLLLLF